MAKIKEYYEKYKEKYDIFKELINDIVCYEYTNDEKYSILPYYFERGFITKGKKTKKIGAKFTYGFNEKNKLIYVKDDNNQESFLVYFKDSINLFCFRKDKDEKSNPILKYIQVTELADTGLPFGTIQVDNLGKVDLEKYQYEEGRLSRIENPLGFKYGTSKDILNIKYDYNGKIYEIIDSESWLPNGVVFKQIEEFEVEKLKAKIINEISENIIKDVIEKYKSRNDEVIYISLEIYKEPHKILSSIYSRVVFNEERNRYVAKNGNKYERKIEVYSNNSIKIYDEELKTNCNNLIHYYIRYGDFRSECKKIVLSIQNKLNLFAWEDYIEITKDFEILEYFYYD